MIGPGEVAAMRRAIEVAARGQGLTSPNPVVGCVVLDRYGALAGTGHHSYAGGPHAEVVALEQAGERARGGTLVVTLEPCAHTGRTPPCVAAILAAGVARVVIAVRDPHDIAAGGVEALRTGGVEVVTGVCAEAAERVNRHWLTCVRRRRPFVVWKFAGSLDGRAAADDGTSRWITGEPARADVHRLRASVDAVVVGSGTVRADDPRLTVRAVPAARQPLRVVVDTDATTSPDARVYDDSAPTLLVVAPDAAPVPHEGRTAVVRVPRARTGPGVEVTALLAELHARQVVSVLLEAGPVLAGSFWRAGAVDEVVSYLAPVLLGAGPSVLAGVGVHTIGEAVRLDLDEVARIGSDVRITARPRTREEA